MAESGERARLATQPDALDRTDAARAQSPTIQRIIDDKCVLHRSCAYCVMIYLDAGQRLVATLILHDNLLF
jgi:hypothetical protein